MLTSQVREAIPGSGVVVRTYKSHRVPNFDVWYGRHSNSFSISLYGNCDEGTFPEIVATCKSRMSESKRGQGKYTTFSLPTTGVVFNRSSDLFDGIETTIEEESLLACMVSGDYLAWQVYSDWLEERGHWQGMYIRHYINLHLKRVQ